MTRGTIHSIANPPLLRQLSARLTVLPFWLKRAPKHAASSSLIVFLLALVQAGAQGESLLALSYLCSHPLHPCVTASHLGGNSLSLERWASWRRPLVSWGLAMPPNPMGRETDPFAHPTLKGVSGRAACNCPSLITKVPRQIHAGAPWDSPPRLGICRSGFVALLKGAFLWHERVSGGGLGLAFKALRLVITLMSCEHGQTTTPQTVTWNTATENPTKMPTETPAYFKVTFSSRKRLLIEFQTYVCVILGCFSL